MQFIPWGVKQYICMSNKLSRSSVSTTLWKGSYKEELDMQEAVIMEEV